MSAAVPCANYHHAGVRLRFQHWGSVFGSNADDHPIVMRFELDLAGGARAAGAAQASSSSNPLSRSASVNVTPGCTERRSPLPARLVT
jgi:hypothetical protein